MSVAKLSFTTVAAIFNDLVLHCWIIVIVWLIMYGVVDHRIFLNLLWVFEGSVNQYGNVLEEKKNQTLQFIHIHIIVCTWSPDYFTWYLHAN